MIPIIAAIAGGVVALVLAVYFGLRFRRARKFSNARFLERWHDLQRHCATRKTWPLAIIDADDLLDDALKSRRYKGKTTGERLVAAQHTLSDNEAVWFGHKLRNQIKGQDVRKLRKQDILEALNGFRQALKDMGAL